MFIFLAGLLAIFILAINAAPLNILAASTLLVMIVMELRKEVSDGD